MNKTKIFLITAIIVITVDSCGRKEYTEEGIIEIKQQIDSLLYNAKGKKFDWGSGKAFSYFMAYFDNSNELIFINEDYRYRKPDKAFNLYYFKDGNMIYYIGSEMKNNPAKQQMNLTMSVNPDGNVIVYEKVVNGERENLSSDEAEEIVNHAGELRDIVKRKLASKN